MISTLLGTGSPISLLSFCIFSAKTLFINYHRCVMKSLLRTTDLICITRSLVPWVIKFKNFFGGSSYNVQMIYCSCSHTRRTEKQLTPDWGTITVHFNHLSCYFFHPFYFVSYLSSAGLLKQSLLSSSFFVRLCGKWCKWSDFPLY